VTDAKTSDYTLDVCVSAALKDNDKDATRAPAPITGAHEMIVHTLPLSAVIRASSVRVYVPADLRPAEGRTSVSKFVREVLKKFPTVPLLDPVEDLEIKDETFVKLQKVGWSSIRLRYLKAFESSESKLRALTSSRPDAAEAFEKFAEKMRLKVELKALQKSLKAASTTSFKSELKLRKRVLRRLGYVDDDNVVQVKGRVACEIDAADELMVAEMLFNGAFNELAPEHIVCLLSCLVFDEKVCSFVRYLSFVARRRDSKNQGRVAALVQIVAGHSEKNCYSVAGLFYVL
jgi:ATP-dependent RNA helicase DOB1